MTPAQHATAAADQLATSKLGAVNQVRYARLATVHAVLSTALGIGADYTAADTLLATATTAAWSPYLVDQALAHAHLAP